MAEAIEAELSSEEFDKAYEQLHRHVARYSSGIDDSGSKSPIISLGQNLWVVLVRTRDMTKVKICKSDDYKSIRFVSEGMLRNDEQFKGEIVSVFPVRCLDGSLGWSRWRQDHPITTEYLAELVSGPIAVT